MTIRDLVGRAEAGELSLFENIDITTLIDDKMGYMLAAAPCCSRTLPQVKNGPYNAKKREVFPLSNFHATRTEAGRLHSTLQLLRLIFPKLWPQHRNNDDYIFFR